MTPAHRKDLIVDAIIGIAARMNPWEEKNRRRIRLIEKKYNGGLDDHEMAELTRLKREVSMHVRLIAPRSTEVIDEQAVRLERLKRLTAESGLKLNQGR